MPEHQVHAVQGHEAFAVPGGQGHDWRDSCPVKDLFICMARMLLACQEYFCDQVCFRSLSEEFSQLWFSSILLNQSLSSIPSPADWSELFPAGSVSTAELGCTFCPLDGSEICFHVRGICQTKPHALRCCLDRNVCCISSSVKLSPLPVTSS